MGKRLQREVPPLPKWSSDHPAPPNQPYAFGQRDGWGFDIRGKPTVVYV
jgi:hypothetical protein